VRAAVVGRGEEEVDCGQGRSLARRVEGGHLVRRAEDLTVVPALGMRLEGEGLNEGLGPGMHQEASRDRIANSTLKFDIELVSIAGT